MPALLAVVSGARSNTCATARQARGGAGAATTAHPMAPRHALLGSGSWRPLPASPSLPPSSSTRRAPKVGVLKVEGACGCSRLPDRKAPPISVPPQYLWWGAWCWCVVCVVCVEDGQQCVAWGWWRPRRPGRQAAHAAAAPSRHAPPPGAPATLKHPPPHTHKALKSTHSMTGR
jgi:hypothetical protein